MSGRVGNRTVSGLSYGLWRFCVYFHDLIQLCCFTVLTHQRYLGIFFISAWRRTVLLGPFCQISCPEAPEVSASRPKTRQQDELLLPQAPQLWQMLLWAAPFRVRRFERHPLLRSNFWDVFQRWDASECLFLLWFLWETCVRNRSRCLLSVRTAGLHLFHVLSFVATAVNHLPCYTS